MLNTTERNHLNKRLMGAIQTFMFFTNELPTAVVIHPETWSDLIDENETVFGAKKAFVLTYAGIRVYRSEDIEKGNFEIK